MAWVNDIKDFLPSAKIKPDKLESLLGKLNHAAHVITPARHLLTRLYHLLKGGRNGAHNVSSLGIGRNSISE